MRSSGVGVLNVVAVRCVNTVASEVDVDYVVAKISVNIIGSRANVKIVKAAISVNIIMLVQTALNVEVLQLVNTGIKETSVNSVAVKQFVIMIDRSMAANNVELKVPPRLRNYYVSFLTF